MYEIHELASIVPLASEKEQLSLTEDIKMNGQREPVKIWEGKIVDGRCRQLACISLGKKVKVEKLSDKLTYDEVRKLVKSLNTRRNLTSTQKIISAYYDYKKGYGTLDEVSRAWAIARGTLVNANYIAKHRPEYLEPLFNGENITIYNLIRSEDIITNKVNTIAKIIKDNIEHSSTYIDTSNEIEYKYTVEELPINSALYGWYSSKVEEYNKATDIHKEYIMKALLIELAKYKEIKNEDL